MIRSMTAFARLEKTDNWGTVTWEVRSVNHRYLEPHFKLPETLRVLEPKLRDILRKTLARGKIECAMRYHIDPSSNEQLNVNTVLAQQLLAAANQLEQHMPQANAFSAIELLKWPGVLEDSQIDSQAIQATALAAFQEAITQLRANREREGSELQDLVEKRLQGISAITTQVRDQLPGILEQQHQKLIEKFEEARLEVDPSRLEQELVLLAQKSDVAEELDRLDTHVTEVYRVLKKGGSCGRRLDFLMQELNREANTLSSKSIVSDTTQSAVELKVFIEQMREQIQNIE